MLIAGIILAVFVLLCVAGVIFLAVQDLRHNRESEAAREQNHKKK